MRLKLEAELARELHAPTASQRTLAAAKMANIKLGSNRFIESPIGGSIEGVPLVSREKAAALAGVGTSQIDRAIRVLKSGDAA
jgi:hypothetical protein